jgi:hypothetical protein
MRIPRLHVCVCRSAWSYMLILSLTYSTVLIIPMSNYCLYYVISLS